MFQVITGEDEHTAIDGPYARLMKTRKWLLIASAAGAAIHLQLYDATAFKGLVKVLSLPPWLFRASVVAGLAYMLLQYTLLAMQLASTYDLILRERFVGHHDDAIKAAALRVSEAEDALSQHMRRTSNMEEAVLSERVRVLDLDELDAQGETREERREREAEALFKQLNNARDELQFVQKQKPSARTGYRAAEIMIDVFRLGVPAAIALYWLAQLLPAYLAALSLH